MIGSNARNVPHVRGGSSFFFFNVSAKPTDLRVVCAGERVGKQFEI